jgi:hypothetical protein
MRWRVISLAISLARAFPDSFASKPPEEAIAVPVSKAALKVPVGVFVGGIAVALFGVFAMFWNNNDEYSVVILFGMAMMAGGGIWGGVRLLGRAARSIKSNWTP